MLVPALDKMKLPAEWKALFLASGIKEEELEESDLTSNVTGRYITSILTLLATLLEVTATALPMVQKERPTPPTTSEIVQQRAKLKPVANRVIKPGQLPPPPKDVQDILKNVVQDAMKKRREFIESVKQSKNPSNEASLLWSKQD